MANENSNVPATTSVSSQLANMKVEYEIFGEKIKLTYNMAKDILVRGNSEKVTDTDILEFMSLCQFNKLNPFTRESYLVKYGDAPAQIITTQEAFMKRADACPHYTGIKAGIIVIRDGNVIDLVGAFKLPTDTLVGGWAIVRRDDREPNEARVSMAEYDKGQSTWKQMPCTMIRKVAKVTALREAFPTQLGALYIQDEMPTRTPIDILHEDVTEKKVLENANKHNLPPEPQPKSEAKPEGKSDVPPEFKFD